MNPGPPALPRRWAKGAMSDLTVQAMTEAVSGRLALGTPPGIEGSDLSVRRIVARLADLTPGDVYWSLPTREPHPLAAEQALLRGAAGVIVGQRHVEPWAGRFAVEVEDPAWSLWELARTLRQQHRDPVALVVGSLGKTLIREYLRSALGESSADESESNEPWRLPQSAALSLVRQELSRQSVVLEAGCDGADDLESVLGLCQPDLLIVAPVCCETAQQTIAAWPNLSETVVIAADELAGRLGRGGARVHRFGRGGDCQTSGEVRRDADGTIRLRVDGCEARLGAGGRHLAEPALAAWAAARQWGVDDATIADRLTAAGSIPRRCQPIVRRGVTFLDNTASDHPAALASGLATLREWPGSGRRIAVMGLVADDDARGDTPGGLLMHACGPDALIAVGPEAETLVEQAVAAGLRPEQAQACRLWNAAARCLAEETTAGDVVLAGGQWPCPVARWLEENWESGETRVA